MTNYQVYGLALTRMMALILFNLAWLFLSGWSQVSWALTPVENPFSLAVLDAVTASDNSLPKVQVQPPRAIWVYFGQLEAQGSHLVYLAFDHKGVDVWHLGQCFEYWCLRAANYQFAQLTSQLWPHQQLEIHIAARGV